MQELFEISMKYLDNINEYLYNKEKIFELMIIDLKLNNDIKLAIIFNELSEKYRYLIIAIRKNEFQWIDNKITERSIISWAKRF